uniref:Rap-GAP domain-containing protein n=1 Tax=Pinguiococcus pyrenoidosus TaxID=172671 RepID=A0A7R9U367_9STRA
MREVVEAWGRPGGAAEALSRDDELDSSQDGDASSASGVVASSLSSFEGSLAPRRRADAYASSAFEESDDLQEFSVDGSQAADGEGGDVASTSVDSYVGIEEEGLLLNEMQLVESTLEDVDPLKSLLGRRGLRNVDIAYDDPTLLGGHFLLKLAEQETKSQSFERVAHTVYTGDAGSRDADTPSAGAVVRFGSLSSGLASSSKQHPGDTLAQLQMHACHGSENKQIGLICMDRMLCRALETLLKAEFASENLEFLLRVKRFETRARRLACYVDEKIALWEYETSSHSQSLKAEAARLCEMALRIFADHCTPESERQVNLTAKQIREVGDIVKSGNIDSAMFTPAVREVERMIKNDKLQRLFQTVTAAQERVRKFNELLRLDEEMSFHSRVEQRCIDFKTSGKLQPQNHRSLEPVRNTDETSQEPVSITRGMSEANSSDGRPSRLTDMRTQSLKQFMDIHDDLPEELRSESEAGFSEVGKDFLEMENCSAATALAGPRIFMSCMGLLPLQGLPFRTVGSNAGRNGTADLPQALLLDPNASIADRASSFEKGTSAAVKSRGRWPAMAQMLQELDAVRPRQTVSVAVVYVGPGQRTAQECLSNVSKQIVTENPNDALSDAPSTSPDFEAFVDALGWSVVLSKHAGWAGDLDTSPNSADGVSQPYWCDESVEVIFYVAPRMPTVAGNSPQPAKKRLISHASIVVVYFDAAREFLPSTLAYHNPDGSSNADVTVVVQPCRKVKYSQTRTKSVTGLYRISLYTRRGIPAIAALPLLDGALVDRKTLGPLVRRAAINADRAIRRMQVGPYWGSKAAEELVPRTRRKRILQRIAKMYGVKFTDEKLLEMTLGLRSES